MLQRYLPKAKIDRYTSLKIFTNNSITSKFALYCLIGISGVILDITSFSIIKTVIHYQIANIISIHIGIINNFFRNAHYNFKKKDKITKRFVQFYCIGIGGILISTVILHILIEEIGVKTITAKAISIIVIAVLQFRANKNISFN